ncbi:MAG: prepilin-type N-terminal cleavage/methylation domain-containing protein [Ignavibacteriales bacterium]
MKKTRISSSKGFTLIELIIVITIIAVLAVIGMQAYGNITARSNATVDVANAQNIGTAMNRIFAEGKVTNNATYTTGSWKALVGANGIGDVITANTYIPNGLPPVKANGAWGWYYQCTANGSTMLVGAGDGTAAGTYQLYPRPSSFAGTVYNALN